VFNGLKLAARQMGAMQIQNAGTVAGNLCNASPAADGVPVLMALSAEVELSSAILKALYHATGVRVRCLPATPDRLRKAIVGAATST
jgi:CO/xanthine dehydrogenase FAD-binding subunit